MHLLIRAPCTSPAKGDQMLQVDAEVTGSDTQDVLVPLSISNKDEMV